MTQAKYKWHFITDKNGDGKLSVEELYDQLKLAGLDVSM